MRRYQEAFTRHLRDPLYVNGLALVANAGLSALLGFAFWMVAARRFNPDALGVGAAVVSAATLAALIGKAGFDAAIIRYAPATDARGARRLLLRSALASLALTMAVSLAFLAVAAFGLPSLSMLLAPQYAAGFVLLALGTAVAWILDAYYIAQQRAIVVLWRNVAFNVVKLGVPVLLVVAWAGRAVPLAWGIGLAASLAIALALLPRHLRRHVPHASRPEGRPFGYAMRNYALNLSEFLPGLVLPILVLQQLGAEANARFFLAWTVATVAFLASKAIAQSSFAALVRDGSARAALKKGALLSAIVLAPAMLVFGLLAEPLLGLFGQDYGAEGAALLRLLALSIPFVAVTNLYLSYLKARDAAWELTLLPAANLVALLAAMPFALRLLGVEGLGLAWLAIQAASGVYAGARLLAKLRRNTHDQHRTSLRRHPHQG